MTNQPGNAALIAATLALALSACGKKPAEAEAPVAAAPVPAGPTVERAAAPVQPPPTAAAPATVLDSQLGLKGSTWDLTKAKVAGNILTVQFTVTAGATESVYESTRQKIADVAVIDDATSQRYGVLKDDTGKPMASPVSDDGQFVGLSVAAGSKAAVWFKFPVPPATSETVSIVVPEVGPFDGVKVQR